MNLPNRSCCFSIVCTVFTFFLSSCAFNMKDGDETKLKTVSIIDRNGMSETFSTTERLNQYQSMNFLEPLPYQKVLRIYERDKLGNIQAKITSYHSNGQPKQYLEVLNSRALGNYYEWHPSGKLKLKTYIIGGEADLSPSSEKSWLFDGTAFVWEETGTLLANILYEKGNLQGESTYYHPNGCLWKIIPYKNNEINGDSEIFMPNGDLLQKTGFVKGKKEGHSFRYWNKDQIAAFEQYKDDLLQTGRYFDLNGMLISEVKDGEGFRAVFGKYSVAELQEYKDGVQEGVVKIMGTDNSFIRKYHTKNNLKHGVEIEYYEIPNLRDQPKLSISWYEGKIQGIVKTWYDNGIQESKREMSNNKKNGISTAWYRNSQLMLLEEYDHDKLIRGEYYRKGENYPISRIKDSKGLATIFDEEGNFIRKINYQDGVPKVGE